MRPEIEIMRYSIPCFLLLAGVLFSCNPETRNKTILVVFAHPDDETTIGPVMNKYSEQNEVYLLLATDGSFGVTEHAGIPAGDSLVEIRKKETACSCEALGIHPPVFLDLQDGLGLNGHGNFYEMEPLLKERLLEAILEVKPDIIITFGPGGDTGHPDHRLVGAITTEILLREDLMDEMDLYYFSWTRHQAEKYKMWNLNYLDEGAMDIRVSYEQKHEDAALASIRCHRSQYTEELMEEWIQLELDDPSNILYFRSFAHNRKIRDHF